MIPTKDDLIYEVCTTLGRSEDDAVISLVDKLLQMFERLQNLQQTDVVRSLPLVEALEQYNGVLVEELNEVVSMAAAHGWRSSRVEIGEQLRNRIAELKRQ